MTDPETVSKFDAMSQSVAEVLNEATGLELVVLLAMDEGHGLYSASGEDEELSLVLVGKWLEMRLTEKFGTPMKIIGVEQDAVVRGVKVTLGGDQAAKN